MSFVIYFIISIFQNKGTSKKSCDNEFIKAAMKGQITLLSYLLFLTNMNLNLQGAQLIFDKKKDLKGTYVVCQYGT